jgi:hypothetical protein
MSDFLAKISFLLEKKSVNERRLEMKSELTAMSRIFPRTIAEISSGVKNLSSVPVLI